MTAVSAAPPSPLRDNATVTPVCATEVVSPEFMDEPFPAFDAYGSAEEQEFVQENEKENHTILYLLSTILFLRLRRFIFGMAGFVRSIFFGHLLKFLLTYVSPSPETWEAISHSPWLEPLLGNEHYAKDPHAWPPPTLRVLAILTILAFIVHPDGMTWILLGKLRNAIYALLESSTTCWNFIIADFGILTTMAALATFMLLFCLTYVVVKTLSSKTPKGTTGTRKTDRKKKKKKGNHPRGGRGRIKGGKSKQHSAVETQHRAVSPPRKPEEAEAASEQHREEEVASVDTSQHKTEFLPKELTTKGPALQPSRSRGESSSTVETTLMDDHSIDTASVQSISSAPSATSTVVSRSPRPLHRLEEEKKKNSENKKRTNTNKKSGRKGSAANKGYGAATSPFRSDVYRPPNKNASSSPVNNTPVNTPNSGRSRSRRGGGNANGGRPFRSLADRMASSPVPPSSNGSLFSTPLSSPAHASMSPTTTTGKRNPATVPGLQAPILTPPSTKPSSSLFSHEPTASTPTAQTGSPTVFYNASSYDSFSHGGGRSTPGKIELAAFLARAGVVGTACEDLVEALVNVDSLYRLSDAQFELYNVSPATKLRIDGMLEARRRARMESTLSSATTSPVVTRPPPGLSAPPGIAQSAVLMSPPRLNQATYARELSPSPGYSSITGRTDVDFGGSPTLSGVKPQLPSLSHPPLSTSAQSKSLYEQGDEEIEAELQELGGQMVGSILDF